MTEHVITPEMVQKVTPVGRARAERIAVYATHRFAGLLVLDAARESELVVGTAQSYDKWLPLLRQRFDLPEPPKAALAGAFLEPARYRKAGMSGGHQSQHVARRIVSPDCQLCTGATR